MRDALKRLEVVRQEFGSRWGLDRLPLLQSDPDVRDRVRELERAIESARLAKDGEMLDLLADTYRRAYVRMEAEALAHGHAPFSPELIMADMPDGGRLLIAPDPSISGVLARTLPREWANKVEVWSVQEVADLIAERRKAGDLSSTIKRAFPGATRKTPRQEELDDEIPF
jgi:hypothetical protein